MSKGQSLRHVLCGRHLHRLPHATADAYDDALKLCSEEAAKLVDEWGFSPEDAFIFLSVAGDAGVAQACKPAPGGFGTIARFTIPELDATPAPIRAA